MNPTSRASAYKHVHAENETRERHTSDRATHERPPVDRNPGYEEDSDPERVINYLPATARSRSPICARSRNEGPSHGVRNHNHPERGRPTTDLTEQRKRKLCEEISLAIKGTNKRKKSEQVSFILFGGH
jgi:hypothetical protein